MRGLSALAKRVEKIAASPEIQRAKRVQTRKLFGTIKSQIVQQHPELSEQGQIRMLVLTVIRSQAQRCGVSEEEMTERICIKHPGLRRLLEAEQ